MTWQRAFSPHVPGTHGFTHFWLMHALSRKHSELNVHSGRQAGGLPTQYSTHEQIAWPFVSRHWLYGPHGDGMHGLCMAIGAFDVEMYGKTDKRERKVNFLLFRREFFHRQTQNRLFNRIETTRKKKQRTSWYFITANWWISSETICTRTIWRMIGNITFGIRATRASAWINTFLIDAGLCIRTIAIHRTFGTAFNVRIAKVIGQTGTWAGIVFHLTNGICTARWWITWLDNFDFATNYIKYDGDLFSKFGRWGEWETKDRLQTVTKITWDWCAGREWIASELILTTANGLMIENRACCIGTACTNTWINTTFIDTS